MLTLTIIIICLAILIIAAFTDLKTLEVPDWLNYGGIAAGILVHAIYSLNAWTYLPILYSGIGLGIAFAIGCLMFYTGQWGGGDAKLLMAMGALIGFEADKFSFGASFLINLVFLGAAWTLFYGFVLAIKNANKFAKTFSALSKQKKYKFALISSFCCALIFAVSSFLVPLFQIEFLIMASLIALTSVLAISMKSIELSSLYKWMSPDKLTEGDWMMHSVKIDGKQLDPPKLGLEKKHLEQIMQWYKAKKIDKILVRYGIPFTPAFLLAFLATWKFGNVFLEVMMKMFAIS